ncbi:hypothetical protein JCM3766R1_001521 [Sporobolomyces carnicolor]
MDFLQLPYDILEAVIEQADQQTLVSLCLVSKAILEIARPLLYRSLRIHLDFWGLEAAVMSEVPTFAEEEGDLDDFESLSREESEAFALSRIASRQVLLHETYHSSLNWKVWVKELTLDIRRPSVQHPRRADFLRNGLPNLTKLQVASEIEASILGKYLIDNCPRHVDTLDLEYAIISPGDISELLNHLPSLKALILPRRSFQRQPPDLTSIPPSASRVPLLQHLELGYGFRNRVLFSRVAGLAPSLTSLKLGPECIDSIDLSCLSTVRKLGINGEMGFLTGSGPRLLASIITACKSLQRLELYRPDALFSPRSPDKRLEDLRILHKCPSSLASLILSDSGFSARYLVYFLSSPQCRLGSLELSRFAVEGDIPIIFKTTHYDVAAEDGVEKICADRGIQCTWIGGRNEQNRESQEGLSIDARATPLQREGRRP